MLARLTRSAVPTELGLGDPRVIIAVLDGPVDRSHPAFSGAALTAIGPDVTGPAGPAGRHGTHVASVIFGQPGTPVQGLAPYCSGLLIPIFADHHGGGSLSCSQLDLARAIDLALAHGAHVINISGGQLMSSAQPDVMLAQTLQTCALRNVLVIAAAGNDGCDCLHLPAAAGNVLAVGAMDDDGTPLPSSNWGEGYLSQGILAPGDNVPGAAPGGDVVRRSGTSFAAPYVSAVAGLLIARQLAAGRAADPLAVRAALLASATPCAPDGIDDCRRVLAGRLNIHQAIQRITGGVDMSDTVTMNPALIPSSGGHPAHDGSAALPVASPLVASVPIAGITPVTMGSALAAHGSGAALQMSGLVARAPAPAAGQIVPSCGGSECGCGGGETCSCGGSCGGGAHGPQLVYALGRIGYDFGTEARRDSFIQAMPHDENNPHVTEDLLSYFDAAPYEAPGLIWTLNLDATPIYAIEPAGPFAAAGYERLRETLSGQFRDGVELVSVPGVIGGKVRLQSGQVVPVIVPALRGLFSWSTQALVEHVIGTRSDNNEEQVDYDRQAHGLSDFLNRIYYDLRNLGITPEDRALNFAATNAAQVADVVRSATSDLMDLDTLTVYRSPICRPDSDCFDVEVVFFNPGNITAARRVYRFTIDVSDIIPVSIGSMRSWTKR